MQDKKTKTTLGALEETTSYVEKALGVLGNLLKTQGALAAVKTLGTKVGKVTQGIFQKTAGGAGDAKITEAKNNSEKPGSSK